MSFAAAARVWSAWSKVTYRPKVSRAAAAGRMWGMVDPPDLGPPTSYLALPEGVPVYTADGEEAGRLTHVLAAEDKDIFDGLIVQIGGRRVFVDAPQVDELYERGVVLRLSSGEVTRLPEPSASPAAMGATPDDTTPDGLGDKLRRAWDMLSGNY